MYETPKPPTCIHCGAPLKCPTHSCGTCNHLGLPRNCTHCAGGTGWPCKVDKDGTHVHPDMAACRQWEARPPPVQDAEAEKFDRFYAPDPGNGDDPNDIEENE